MTASEPLLTDEQQYLSEVRRLPPLSDEEYAHLAQQIRLHRIGAIDPQEGQYAAERMITGHLQLVSQIAKRLHVRTMTHLDALDLIQIGNLTLVKAMQDYPFEQEEGTLGRALHKRVAWTIINAIHDTANTIRIPSRSLRRAQQEGRADTLPMHLRSLDQLLSRPQERETPPLLETLEAPAFLLRPPPSCPPETGHLLALLLAELPPRQREVLQLLSGLGRDEIAHSREEISAMLHVSERTVENYERRALQHLQELYQTYERETGHACAFLSDDQGFMSYIEQRRTNRQRVGSHAKTRVVNAQLHQAFIQMQQAEEWITGETLAKRAGVGVNTASHYLQTKGHNTLHLQHQDIAARLDRAWEHLQAQHAPITAKTLMRAASVGYGIARTYLHRKGYREKALKREQIQQRLFAVSTAMQEKGEQITAHTLAARAQTSSKTARKYLPSLRVMQEKGREHDHEEEDASATTDLYPANGDQAHTRWHHDL